MFKKIGISILVGVTVFNVGSNSVMAVCGSYFSNQPVGQQCIDLDYDPVEPFVICSTNSGLCCSDNSECPGGDQPTPTLPVETGYEPSTQNCGEWHGDLGLHRNVCLDDQDKILSVASE